MSTVRELAAHPYADAWPLLGQDDLAELAADIDHNGLRDPIVLYKGTILDGRNRHAACMALNRAGEYVEFDGDDDAALAFVQSVNNARRHQSKGSLAASWALSMLVAGKRVDGRWAYGSVNSYDRKNLNDKDRAQLGVIADYATELLAVVRDDTLTLNAAHEKACRARDEERANLDAAERIKAEEAEAAAVLPAEYAAQVGTAYSSARVAFTAWEDANRAEAARRRRDKERKAEAERARIKNAEDTYGAYARAVQSLQALTVPQAYERFLSDELPIGHKGASPAARAFFTPATLRSIADALTRLADELEN